MKPLYQAQIKSLLFSVLYSAEQKRMTQLIGLVNKSLLVASIVIFSISCLAQWENAIPVAALNVCLYVSLHFYLRTNYIRSAGLLTILSLWSSVTYVIYNGDGVHDIAIIIYPILLTIGALLFNVFYYTLLTVMSALSIIVIGHAELSGFHVNKFSPLLVMGDIYTAAVLISLSGVLIRLMTEFAIATMERADARERQYGAILNSLHDAVFIHDADSGKVLDVNETMLSMFGYCREDIDGFTPNDLSSPEEEYAPEVSFALMAKAKNEGVTNFRWRARHKSGRVFWVDVVLTLTEIDGQQRVVAIVRDIDLQMQLEDQLKQAEKLTAVGQLAGGIAHDFNNMLAGIMGAAEVLSLQQRSAEDQGLLDLIVRTAQQAGDLTGKLLSFSKKREMVLSPVDLCDIIREAIELLRRSIDKRVIIHLDLQLPKAVILGDRTQLLNVFLNLGINANDALNGEGEIIFRTQAVQLDAAFCAAATFNLEPGHYVDAHVIDNGPGIPESIRTKIFEPFFSTKNKNKNTGLGLAAAYGIIKEHRGAISVVSEEQKGADFFICLPLTQQTNSAVSGPHDAIHGTGTVLLVDDEPNIIFSVTAMLTRLGYDVLSAENGREAVDLYRTQGHIIDVVLLDMVMPEMNGRECFYALKALDAQVRVLLSSGFTDDMSVNELLEAGAQGFLAKPYRLSEIARLVESCLN